MQLLIIHKLKAETKVEVIIKTSNDEQTKEIDKHFNNESPKLWQNNTNFI